MRIAQSISVLLAGAPRLWLKSPRAASWTLVLAPLWPNQGPTISSGITKVWLKQAAGEWFLIRMNGLNTILSASAMKAQENHWKRFLSTRRQLSFWQRFRIELRKKVRVGRLVKVLSIFRHATEGTANSHGFFEGGTESAAPFEGSTSRKHSIAPESCLNT